MNGIGMTDLMSKNVYNMVSLSSKMVQEYYPEIVNRSYILNTPMLFSGFFNLVKPLLGTRTQEALSMPGGKFKQELAGAIDLQYLPAEYGGTCPYNPMDCIDRGDFVKVIEKALELKKWDITPEDFEPKAPELVAEPTENKPQPQEEKKTEDKEEKAPAAEEKLEKQ